MTSRPPRVMTAASRLQWAAVVAYLVAIGAADVYGNAVAGPVAAGMVIGTLIRFAGWVALLPATFAALDRFPLVRGQVIVNLSATVGLAALAGFAHGVITVGLAHVIALGVDGLPADLVGAGALSAASWRGATSFPVFLFLPHLVVQRILAGRQRRDQAFERELSLAKARLHALSVELQPHFLFNTLNSIAGLVRNDPRTAETMLVQLSDLLRLTLEGAAGGESSLGDEIERLELYIALQRMRFGPRLTVTTAIPDQIRGASVPTMLLQPLVENAMSHGIGPKDGPGAIAITGERRGDRLVLAVEDDGVGLPDDAPARERIGIGNTRARLTTLFPDDHRFDLTARAAGGVRATIDIPFRTATPGARAHR